MKNERWVPTTQIRNDHELDMSRDDHDENRRGEEEEEDERGESSLNAHQNSIHLSNQGHVLHLTANEKLLRPIVVHAMGARIERRVKDFDGGLRKESHGGSYS
ncbi:Uncharacterized protein TCM_020517 [Theobroma cacao]|uniref:Uncharacterized protein n=1 Tax=Theobroma cacao TaxID=3641 RepID=A0A061ELH3_THECC|nr:Uncharacterized protein TCM_020517 [Theobroma cacao]